MLWQLCDKHEPKPALASSTSNPGDLLKEDLHLRYSLGRQKLVCLLDKDQRGHRLLSLRDCSFVVLFLLDLDAAQELSDDEVVDLRRFRIAHVNNRDSPGLEHFCVVHC